jgi:putative membrane-bound dehydrogenase-like protein
MSRPLRFLLLGLVLLGATTAQAQLTPDRAERSFTVADGLAFSLWASEPLFVNPTCMDIDHRGRVWVCESVNYRNRLRGMRKLTRPEGDRIVILEDTKGTGRADRATTFYQSPDTLAPLGIAVAKDPVGPGYKVFVCQSPDILVFEDKDGDGKADGPPKKLLSGFRGFDHDHGVHGILIGPDMKLYFSVGDAGVGGLQSSDGKGRRWSSNGTDCRAGTIWRCDLDGKNLELIAHNFRNEYEPCVDSFGNIFVSDNDDDGSQQTRICHVLPGGNYGYHPRGRGESHWHEEQPGVVPKILRTYFGSPTGMCVYEGKLLPKKYWGQLLHTDAGPRHVRAYHLTPKGASYAVEREDIVTSSDNWFRPSDICVAPDGSVFVADWYDPGVGGHGMGDITRGRIYRLAPKGNKPSVPKVDLSKPEGIRGALASPNLATRYMAMAKLDEMRKKQSDVERRVIDARTPSKEIYDLLLPAIEQKEDRPLRARAIWQLARALPKRLPVVSWRRLHQMLPADVLKDADLVQLMLRVGKEFFGVSPADPWLREYRNYVLSHPSPAVRREALIQMRDADPADDDSEEDKWLIIELMKKYDGKDRFYLAAIGIAIGHHDEKRRELLLADFDKHFATWDDKVAGLVWELRPPRILPLLEKRLTDAKLSAEQRARIVDILAASRDDKAGQALLALLKTDVPAEVSHRILDSMRLNLPGRWKALQKSREMNEALQSLLEKSSTRVAGLQLVGIASRADRLDIVLKLARSKDESAEVRKAAVATLGQLRTGASVEGLTELLRSAGLLLQPDVAIALGELARPAKGGAAAKQALKALQGAVTDDSASAPLRLAAVTALASGRPGSVWLLELHKQSKLPESLVASAGRLLRNSPYRDLQNRALVAFPAPGKLNIRKLPSIPALAARKGNAERGKKLLADSIKSNLQCLKCHTVRGVGGQVGPDLSVIGKKASRDNLIESILNPSKAIADQYVTWTIETDKGLSISGLLVEENKEVVVLRDAEGRDTRVRTGSIQKRTKGTKSLMPDDLVAHLSEDDLVDLVEYLFALKTPALAVDAWNIVGPFDNGAGMEGLDRVFEPEKKIDLKAGYAGKHGTVRWRAVKPGQGGYVDLMAFFAPRSSQIVSYLTCDVVSPVEQEASILLGTDDGAKLWVNGRLVHTVRATRAALPEQDTVRVKLKKGVNTILLKINNGDGPHGFYFTVLAEQELKLAGKK